MRLHKLVAFLAAAAHVFALSTLDPPPALARVPLAAAPVVVQPSDVDLFPLVLVSTLAGGLHALDRESGVEQWAVPPTLPAPRRSPVTAPGEAGDDEDDFSSRAAGGQDELFLIDPREGEVLLATRETTRWKLRKLGVTVPDLVQASFQSSPVHFASDPNPSRLFVGSQSTALLAIDMSTGEVVNAVDHRSAAGAGGTKNTRNQLDAGEGTGTRNLEELLDGMEGAQRDERQILWLTRTDYTLQIHTPSRPPLPSQTLSYSTFAPRPDPSLQDPQSIFALPATLDGTYIQMATAPGKAGLFGLAETSSGSLVSPWRREVGAELPVGVWDVFVLRDTGGLFVARQPNPRRALIPSQAGRTITSAGTLVTRGGGGDGTGLVALTGESFPFLGIAGTLPFPTPGRLEGWHPGQGAPALGNQEEADEGRELETREMWDVQLGEGLAKAVERQLIEAGGSVGRGGAEEDNDSVARPNRLAKTFKRRGLWATLARWLGFALLCAGLAFVGRHITASPSSLPSSSLNVEHGTPALPDASVLSRSHMPDEDVGAPSAAASAVALQGLGFPLGEKDLAVLPPLATPPDAQPAAAVDGELEGRKKKRRQRRKGKKDGTEDDVANGEIKDEAVADAPAAVSDSLSAALAVDQATPIIPQDEGAPPPAISRPPVLPPVSVAPSPPPTAPSSEALIISDTLLGTGSHGTLVFKGTFQSRPVAVKRLLSHFTSLHAREITLLSSSDRHENIVRYFYQERREPWLLIALELCPCSLAELVDRRERAHAEIWSKWEGREVEALMGAVRGVEHLHSLKICHRDIKPQNILVTLTKTHSIRLLISDFGLAKQQSLDQSSFGATLHGASAGDGVHQPMGSLGWRAPELLLDTSLAAEGDERWEVVGDAGSGSGSGGGGGGGGTDQPARSARLSRKVDVFALGCVLGWALSGGVHPFGGRLERERNIIKGRPDLSALDPVRQQEAANLVTRMVAFDSRARPSLPLVLQHPLFWPPARQLSFLQDASDRFEILPRAPLHAWLAALERRAGEVVGERGWMDRLSGEFEESLGKYRKYDVHSLRDLLRALRNKRHHLLDLPPALRAAMSPLPAGFLAYFTSRFPRLVVVVWEVIGGREAMWEDEVFRGYFPEGGWVP